MKFRSSAFRIASPIGLLVLVAAYVGAQPDEQVIQVVAKEFEYIPNDIHLKRGVPVVLELTTRDVLMGFNVPDLGVRADIVPGKVARVRLVADKAGTFAFACDIFCGSGHEEMVGRITVAE